MLYHCVFFLACALLSSTALLHKLTSQQRLSPLSSLTTIKGKWKDSPLLRALNEISSHEIAVRDSKNSIMEHKISKGSKLPLEAFNNQVIYERWFYEDLLAQIHAVPIKQVILIGSPGIGKSFFQFYYIARILQAQRGYEGEHVTWRSFPPDRDGRSTPPNLIFRQCGKSMTVYDTKNFKELKVSIDRGFDEMEVCDPTSSLFLFEPGRTETLEVPFEGLDLPILATVSPNPARYKEFVKNGAARLFMPTFELAELLALGQRMLQTVTDPIDLAFMTEQYTSEEIERRFCAFGGIMRHVLPVSAARLKRAYKIGRAHV